MPQDNSLQLVAEFLCWFFFAYKWVVIFSILLTWIQADPNNQAVMWVNKVSRPLWEFCAKYLPRSMRGFDAYAALMLLIFLQILLPASLKSFALNINGLIGFETVLKQIGGHAIQGVGIVAESVVFFMILVLIVWFVITLVNPPQNHPIVRVAYILADPIITPIQKVLPRTRTDYSPLVGILGLYVFSKLFLTQVIGYGFELSLPVRICLF